MLTIRVWTVIISCFDALIIALFLLESARRGSFRSFMRNEIVHYSPETSSADVVLFAIIRLSVLLLIYVAKRIKSLVPFIVCAAISTVFGGVKVYLLVRGYGHQIFQSLDFIVVCYCIIISWCGIIGCLLISKSTKKIKYSWDDHSDRYPLTRNLMINSNEPLTTFPDSPSPSYGSFGSRDSSYGSFGKAEARYFQKFLDVVPVPPAQATNPDSRPDSIRPDSIRPDSIRSDSPDIKPIADIPVSATASDSVESVKRPKTRTSLPAIMPSIPRLIVLMTTPETGLELMIKKTSDQETVRCFSGKSAVDWMVKVMKQIKQRTDCVAIAQQLMERGFIAPLKADKNRLNAFLDNDTIYCFTEVIESVVGNYRADTPFLGLGVGKAEQSAHFVRHDFEPAKYDRAPRSRSALISQPSRGSGLSQFLPPPKISKSMRNFLKEMSDPVTGVTTGEYVINNVSYSNCFSGKEVTNWLLSKKDIIEREHAVLILQNMASNNILLSVYPIDFGGQRNFYDDTTHLYTFCSLTQVENEPQQTTTDQQAKRKSIDSGVDDEYKNAAGKGNTLLEQPQKVASHPTREENIPPVIPNQEYPAPNQEYPAPKQEYPPPKQDYPAPKQEYPTPKQEYPPPKQGYTPPKQGYIPPKQEYPAPKQEYLTPKQEYLTPKQEYPPPKQEYPTPKQEYSDPMHDYSVPKQEYPTPELPPVQRVAVLDTTIPLQPEAKSTSDLPISSSSNPDDKMARSGSTYNLNEFIKSDYKAEADVAANTNIIVSKVQLNGEPEASVASWLVSAGCAHLVGLFESEGISFEMLPVMTEEDLRDINIPLPDIKKLMKHIKILEKKIIKESKARASSNKKKGRFW